MKYFIIDTELQRTYNKKINDDVNFYNWDRKYTLQKYNVNLHGISLHLHWRKIRCISLSKEPCNRFIIKVDIIDHGKGFVMNLQRFED